MFYSTLVIYLINERSTVSFDTRLRDPFFQFMTCLVHFCLNSRLDHYLWEAFVLLFPKRARNLFDQRVVSISSEITFSFIYTCLSIILNNTRLDHILWEAFDFPLTPHNSNLFFLIHHSSDI